jgi:hypothetical protein
VRARRPSGGCPPSVTGFLRRFALVCVRRFAAGALEGATDAGFIGMAAQEGRRPDGLADDIDAEIGGSVHFFTAS